MDIVDAIESFPVRRTVHHCGESFDVSPLAIYTDCPSCGVRLKVRSFASAPELEDVFDAVFTWMNHPGAAVAVEARRKELAEDDA